MATRLKTVEYWFPELAAVTDNTDTNFTQITVYLPETGTKTFRSVTLEVIIQDAEATSNNVTRRQISMSVGGSAYTTLNNTNLFTSSGEQKWLEILGNFTALFNASWSGASMVCDARVLCDSAIATPVQAWRCATAKLTITYEYDDTSTTHVKTVRIPLNAPIANLGITKPGTATASIPNLSTYLPENSVTIRQTTIIVQGNEESSATSDKSMSWEVDTRGTYTTGTHEGALNTACWYRHCQIQSFPTNASYSWYLWGSVAVFAHAQAWMVVTYEFNEAASTTILNSLLLPMSFDSPAGGTTSSDYQRASRDIWIEEPTTITIIESALFLFWDQMAAVTGIQFRVNAGAWSGALTSTAAVLAGSCGAMYRCESYISSLVRGKNTIYADIYRTDTADLMFNMSAFWMLNYTSGRHTSGVGAHNHSIQWNIVDWGTTAVAQEVIVSATNPVIPESEYFINALGTEFVYQSNTTGLIYGIVVQVERLAAEGGIQWENLYADVAQSDGLTGVRQCWSMARDIFRRFPNDSETDRMDLQTARRYKSSFSPSLGWRAINLWFTYHTIQFAVGGTITGSAGGTVNLLLVRYSDRKVLKTGSRTGNGAYSFVWYDNTLDMFVDAYENTTHVGRSENNVAV